MKKSVKDYLLGNNKNLFGSVIAFRRSLTNTKIFSDISVLNGKQSKVFYPEGFAIILYFDHTVGRIVRHLYNPNLVFWGVKRYILDPQLTGTETPEGKIIMAINDKNLGRSLRTDELPEDVIVNKGDTELINGESGTVRDFTKLNPYQYNYLWETMGKKKPLLGVDIGREMDQHNLTPEFTTHYLHNGKINKQMSFIFNLDLVRDYISTRKIYNITDMKYIRLNTTASNLPSSTIGIKPVLNKENKVRSLNINQDNFFRNLNSESRTDLPELVEIGAENIKNYYTPTTPYEIYMTKGISTKILDSFNYKLTYKLNKEFPPVIRDLRRLINSKTILNNKDLIIKINYFNDLLSDKLKNM